MLESILSVRNIKKTFQTNAGPVQALNDISFDIAPGTVFALLGVNGAGKTTLSSILATVHPPTSGDVLFKGTSIYTDLWHYRRSLGFCPQYANLDPYLTVQENLIFSGQYFGLPYAAAKQRALELVERYHLGQYANFFTGQLSGGTKQRVLVARSLMHQPTILILDEPTVALDPDIRRRIWQEILDLKSQGVTIILTTHYLEEAEHLADEVCLLHAGKVQVQKTIAELKREHGGNSLETIFLNLTKQAREQE